MKKIYTILIFFSCVLNVTSQTWERAYSNTYAAVGVLQSKENEFNSSTGGIVLGMTYTSPQITGLYRFNTFGDTLWTKKVKLDSINYSYYPEQTASLLNGDYLVSGYAEGMPWSTYGRRFMVMQLTSSGNCTRLYQYNINNMMSESIVEGSATSNSHYIVFRNDSALPPFGNNTSYKTIIRKLSSNGLLQWQKILANVGPSFNSLNSTTEIKPFKATKDGGCIYSKSIFTNTVQIEKLDSMGNSQWTANLTSLLNAISPMKVYSNDMVCLKDSTFLISCGVSNSSTGGSLKSYLLRFNKNGLLLDSARFDSTAFLSLTETSNGKIISNYMSINSSTISSAGLMFFDNNLNYLNFYPTPFSMAPSMFGKISPNNMGGGLFSIGYSGFTYVVNFDSLLVTHPFKYSGNWSLDKNKNCNLDLTDGNHGNQILKIKETTASDSYCLTKSDGNYSANLPSGTYTITHTPFKYRKYECPSNGGYTFTVTGAGASNNNNLLDTLVPGINDVGNVIFANGFTPGWTTSVSVYYFNNGTTLSNSKIKVLKDTSLLYVSSSPTVSSISGDTLIFNIPNFDYDSVGYLNITVSTKTFIPLGTKIVMTSTFPLLNDSLPSDNIDTLSLFVTSSYDPNDKSVSEPFCMNINNDLVYRVRFQNTGTASAKNILVVDTLDTNLELTSFKLLYKSHPNLDIKWRSNNRMEYRFDNINLPDSNANEPLSHGEFVYSIKANPSTPLNTKIRNRAWIYFDYNLPVITNVVENMLCSTVTSLTQYNNKSKNFRIFPNPASSNIKIKYDGFVKKLEIYDIAGHLIQSNLINNEISEYSIEIPNLSDGLYFIKLYGNNETFTNKLIIMQ